MKKIIDIFFAPGSEFPPPQGVFMSVVLVSAVQIASYFVINAGFLLLGVSLNEIMAMAGVSLAMAVFFRYDLRRLFPFNMPSRSQFLLMAAGTFCLDIFIDYMVWFSDLYFHTPVHVLDALSGVMGFSSPWEFAAKILIFCLLTGICEEIYFRGFCQGSLCSRLGSWIGVITASLIFASMHGNPWYFPLYFILGLFFGMVYKKSGTLVAPIFCHVLNNIWSMLTHNLGIKFPLSEGFNYSELTILIPAILFAIYSIFQIKQVFEKRRPTA